MKDPFDFSTPRERLTYGHDEASKGYLRAFVMMVDAVDKIGSSAGFEKELDDIGTVLIAAINQRNYKLFTGMSEVLREMKKGEPIKPPTLTKRFQKGTGFDALAVRIHSAYVKKHGTPPSKKKHLELVEEGLIQQGEEVPSSIERMLYNTKRRHGLEWKTGKTGRPPKKV